MIFFTRKKLLINNEYIVDQQNKKIIENSISDYLSNDNPTKELLKDLSRKGYSYKNFSPEELEKIVLLFLHKNSPKEIEDIMSHVKKPALQTNLSDIFVDSYDPFIFMLDSPSFYRNLINNLDGYKKYNGKIKEIFDLLMEKDIADLSKNNQNFIIDIFKTAFAMFLGYFIMDGYIHTDFIHILTSVEIGLVIFHVIIHKLLPSILL